MDCVACYQMCLVRLTCWSLLLCMRGGRHSPFLRSLQQKIPHIQTLLQKKNRFITRERGLYNVTLSYYDLPVSNGTPSSRDTSRHKRCFRDRGSDSPFKRAYKILYRPQEQLPLGLRYGPVVRCFRLSH
jgi:hypothetical protein